MTKAEEKFFKLFDWLDAHDYYEYNHTARKVEYTSDSNRERFISKSIQDILNRMDRGLICLFVSCYDLDGEPAVEIEDTLWNGSRIIMRAM